MPDLLPTRTRTKNPAVKQTALLVILTMALRISLKRRQKHALEFTALWRPVLMNALVDPAACELPMLQTRDRLNFLNLQGRCHNRVSKFAAVVSPVALKCPLQRLYLSPHHALCQNSAFCRALFG